MTLDVLCMMAHPDDAEIICGGTLIKLKDQGYRVGIADMSRGEMGTRGSAEKRAEEAQCAAGILGVDVRVNLELPDGRIANTVENREKVVRAIREYKPSLIFTHGPNNRNPDHTHTHNLIKESCFTAGLAKYDTGQKHHRPEKILFSMEYFDAVPNIYIDITAQYERKMKAVACYRSQLFDPSSEEPGTYIASDRFMQEVESRFRYFGARIHADYAEGFRLETPIVIDDVVKEIALRGNIPGQNEK